MSIKVQNATDQVVPVILVNNKGGEEIRISPRKTVVLGIDKLSEQLKQLISKGILKIRK